MNLAVIGTVFVDVKGYPLGDFIPQGRNAGRIQEFHGGVSRNIAEDIANMEENAMLISLVDEGGSGVSVVNHLNKKNVDTRFVKATADGMGTWLAVFDDRGEVYASISKRPNLLPICDTLEENGDEIFTWADAILLEIDIDEEIVKKTFELAEKYSKKVYVVISNISIALERMDYIKKSGCFVCNRNEAAMFFGLLEKDFSTAAKGLNILEEKFPDLRMEAMVVTLDEDGAIFCNDKGESGICPAEAVEVVDTTGAGDSFFAGVSIGLARGENLKTACMIGTHMASRVIHTVGNVYR